MRLLCNVLLAVNIEWQHLTDVNMIYGLVSNGAGTEQRPAVFYFGNMGDDWRQCSAACQQHARCVVSTIFYSFVLETIVDKSINVFA